MSARENDLVGKILLGKLEVVRKIGGGGMGVVYEVSHRLTGHRRALKVVHAKYADRPRFMKRLLREAKVAGTLSTPYVVETYDAGRLEDGAAYVLMELLEGRSLYQLLSDEGRLSPRRLAGIMCQLTEGMAVAHAAGIVHRDLKPENVFVLDGNDGERVKILDFGVSKFDEAGDAPTRLTVEGTLVGTPYYMSPEQAAGRPVDARTDVYAMGVMMYEALTGRLPFEAESVGALFVKIGAGEHVPLRARRPDLDEGWCALVEKAFHRDPEARFSSAEALRRALLQRLEGGSAAARAKTISDGVRATLGYSEELPRPPRVPPDAVPVDGRPADAMEEDPPVFALSPPPATPPPERRGVPAWIWAVGGALAVLLVVVPWQLADDEGNEAMSARRHEAVEATMPPPALDRPPDPTPPTPEDAGVLAQTEEPEEAPPARPPSTPATAAGLDPNPYRR